MPFLAPLLGSLFSGGALTAGIVAGGLGLIGQGIEGRRQRRAQQAERRDIEAAEARSQEAYRDSLRTRRAGSGSFRPQGGQAFTPTLKSLTGQ